MDFKLEYDDSFLNKLEELSKPTDVKLEDLLTEKFLLENTQFKNFDDFTNKLGVSTAEEFKALPDEDLDKFIKDHSSCDSWKELLELAATEYFKAKLES